jgi:hypothetical protein
MKNIEKGKEKEKIAKFFTKNKNSIPYIVELQKLKLVDSVISCILMARMEHYFAKYPKGFFKYRKPCELQIPLDGLSWLEELGIKRSQFRSAINKICICYNTINEYEKAKLESGGIFKDKYYCSVKDQKNYNRTIYYRNHKLVDREITKFLLSIKGK